MSFDVALSFAGEDRQHARQLANELRARNISVFYDEHEQATLWGKNLYTHLSNIYHNEATYCVVFLSRHYAEKRWTNFERETSQARAFSENREYLLPIRLDDTVIPGLLTTVAFVKWPPHNASSIAELLEAKLKTIRKPPGTIREPPTTPTKPAGESNQPSQGGERGGERKSRNIIFLLTAIALILSIYFVPKLISRYAEHPPESANPEIRHDLTTEQKIAIDAFIAQIANKQVARILVDGYTDSSRGREFNLAIGMRRSYLVSNYLNLAGVQNDLVETSSFGGERVNNGDSTPGPRPEDNLVAIEALADVESRRLIARATIRFSGNE